MQRDKTVTSHHPFPCFCLWMSAWIYIHAFNNNHIDICAHIHITLCIYQSSLYKSLWEAKVLDYLTLHTLHSQCESNHLKKHRAQGETAWSNPSSLSFISQLTFSKPVTQILQLSAWPGEVGRKHTRNAAFQQPIWVRKYRERRRTHKNLLLIMLGWAVHPCSHRIHAYIGRAVAE